MNEVKAYPLSWPSGWPRTAEEARKSGNFTKEISRPSSSPGDAPLREKGSLSIADAIERLLRDLRLMGITEASIIISTNVPLTSQGWPRSGREPLDPGAAVYWLDGKKQMVMAIDRYDRLADNLAAVAATIDALRRIERHGGGTILERAFSGFAALPAPGQISVPWRQVLCVGPNEARQSVIEESYRKLRSKYHPDRETGSAAMFNAVQVAFEQARAELERGRQTT